MIFIAVLRPLFDSTFLEQILYICPTPRPRAGCNTKSFFKLGIIGFNSFPSVNSVALQSLKTQSALLFTLCRILIFRKIISSMWNAKSLRIEVRSTIIAMPRAPQIYIFIIQRVKARAIPCTHQPPTRGDNTVSVTQGVTATPGATKQLLPADRIYIYIYIYIYARSI